MLHDVVFTIQLTTVCVDLKCGTIMNTLVHPCTVTGSHAQCMYEAISGATCTCEVAMVVLCTTVQDIVCGSVATGMYAAL